MAEANNYLLNHQEVAEALVKQLGIHDGLWGIYLEFAIGGANVSRNNDEIYHPAAIVPVTRIGIQRFEKPSNLTVDAAKVNPLPKTTPHKKATSATKQKAAPK